MINLDFLEKEAATFHSAKPFPHLIIDDFIEESIAVKLASEFPSIEDNSLFSYSNPLEKKSALNDWNRFPATTYRFLEHLCSESVVSRLSQILGIKLYPDFGLHGGGWHMHPDGGKLNPHLDYSIHPKLGLQRRINLIMYLSQDWQPDFGGHFGLWSNDPDTDLPRRLEKEIEIQFNRAVIFDTTHMSWHGLSRQVSTGGQNIRRSLAVYYLCDPPVNVSNRERALYAPTEEQKNNPEIADFIRKRADSQLYKEHYVSKK